MFRSFLSFPKTVLTAGLLLTVTIQALADTDSPTTTDAEKIYLVQMLNQLNALQSLILAAQKTQMPDKRIQFHYTSYQDSQGVTHHGLLEDVTSIKTGISQYLNQPAIEPRIVRSLQGDYVDTKPVINNQNKLVSSGLLEAQHADG
jgi:RAQPRD family integrative conjugative element protein